MCCKEGVAVDIEHAKKISSLSLTLKKPWFQDLYQDNDFPSGWSVNTIVRDGSCVFQKKNKQCRIYKDRPSSCREFPYENGEIFKNLGYLCREARSFKKVESRYKRG